MSISYLSLESSFGETAGLDGRDFIFALLLLLSLRRAAHEVLNPMPGETRGPQSFVRRNKNSKTAYFLYPIRVNPQYLGVLRSIHEKSLIEPEFLPVSRPADTFRACSSRGRVRLQTDVIIHGVPEPLFATEVPLGRLHRNVAEQELDLFQFTTSLVAQARTGSSQIVWGH